MQHGLRIEAVFASLQQGEHMVESNPAYKYNNSANRIISKEEEREDPRRDTSIFEYSVSTQNPSILQELVFPHAIQQLQVSTVNSTYRINPTTRNTTTTRLIPCRLIQGIFQQLLPCIQTF